MLTIPLSTLFTLTLPAAFVAPLVPLTPLLAPPPAPLLAPPLDVTPQVLPDPQGMVTWPQAVVALAIIFALTIFPQLMNLWQNSMIQRKQDEIASGQDEIKRSQGIVVHEMRPNSGTSVKDAVHRIERKVNKLDSRLKRQNMCLLDLEDRIGALERTNAAAPPKGNTTQ